jgi:glycosyltransferase involved in cell wall biosynthesis
MIVMFGFGKHDCRSKGNNRPVAASIKKLKILYAIDALACGGTELQLTGLIDRLDRTRYEPVLCTLKPSPPELTPHDCRHLALEVPKLLAPDGLKAMWNFSRWLKNEKIDIVQTFFQDSTVFAGTAARMAGVPVRLACFRDLGFWRTPRQEMILRRVYPLMTGFLANAQVVKDHFAEQDGISPGKIQVIYNGIDVERLPLVGHPGPTTDIGIVGNLNRRVKRTDLFIEAAGALAADHPEITWHILGDGGFREEFQAKADQLGLGERMVFAGRVADVPSYLAKLQIGVLCSDSEGFSNAVLEYMFKGCAVVATDVGGNAEALKHGETGLLVPPNDAGALAAAIKQLVDNVPLRRRLAGSARRFAENSFNWDRCVAAHEAIYRGYKLTT